MAVFMKMTQVLRRPEKARKGQRSKWKGLCTTTSCQLSTATINSFQTPVVLEKPCTQSVTRQWLFSWKWHKFWEGQKRPGKAKGQNERACAQLHHVSYPLPPSTHFKPQWFWRNRAHKVSPVNGCFHENDTSFEKARKGQERPKVKMKGPVHNYIMSAIHCHHQLISNPSGFGETVHTKWRTDRQTDRQKDVRRRTA